MCDEDITNNFLEVHDIEISHINIPKNPVRIMFRLGYDAKKGEILPPADQIYNCVTPDQARQLIELLQQQLDALDHGDSTYQEVVKH